MNHFLNRFCCSMKTEFYVTTGDGQLSGWSKRKLQSISESQNFTKIKIMVIVWWCAAHLIRYSFLNPDETITSEKYAQAHQWDAPKTAMPVGCIAQQKEPSSPLYWQTTLCTTSVSKLNELAFEVLPHLPYSPDLSPPTTTSSSISTTFCRENTSTMSRRQKMLSKGSSNPKAWILFYRNKQTYFSSAKMCW